MLVKTRSYIALALLSMIELAGCSQPLISRSVPLGENLNQTRIGVTAPETTLPTVYDPARDPAKDLQVVVKLAQSGHKRILLDVGGEWCVWCHKLDDFFATHSDAAQLLNQKFVLLKVNYNPENQNGAFLSHYGNVNSFPFLIVLDSDGTLLHLENTGVLESGNHHDYDKVMAFLKQWAL